ncbi:MAG: NAD(P)-dependent oxidoreductase [Halococcoides sp.]
MTVIVTDTLDSPGRERLRSAGHTIEIVPADDRSALIDAIPDATGLVVGADQSVDAAVIDAAPDLRVIGVLGVDTSNIAVDTATDRGVLVTTAPRASVRATAEFAVGMTFAAVRKIPQGHRRLRGGEWAKGAIIGHELDGKTLGAIGLDVVGQEIAHRLVGLDMDVIAYDPGARADQARRLGAALADDLETVLEAADVVSVHEGRGSLPTLDGAAFDALDGGYLIDVTGGATIDESALATAVDEGVLDGAALDAVGESPLPADSPLREVENVITTPEMATAARPAPMGAARRIADRVADALAGDRVPQALNTPSIPEDQYPTVEPYADLAETAGRIAVQLLADPIDELTITFAGEIAEEDIDIAAAAGFAGALDALGHDASDVNARDVARENGVDIAVETASEAEDFRNLVTVTAQAGDDAASVSGTQFADGESRIVRIADYRVEVVPYGTMMLVHNDDRPGVIGTIGTILGEYDVNIAGMFNSRETVGGDSMTVYNLDERPGDAVVEDILADDRVEDLDLISLDL